MHKLNICDYDINIIRNFIDLYEDTQASCEEYNKLCNEIRNEFQIHERPILKAIENRLNELLLKMKLENNKTLMNRYDELKNKYEQLKPYKKIIEINNSFGIINSKTVNIRQLYVKIKYLYEIYEEINKYKNIKNKWLISIIQTKKIRKIINKIDKKYGANIELINEYFALFKNNQAMIEQFNHNEKIIQALNESRKIVTDTKTINRQQSNMVITILPVPQYTKSTRLK